MSDTSKEWTDPAAEPPEDAIDRPRRPLPRDGGAQDAPRAGVAGDLLTLGQLNRATLERQLLVRRTCLPALDAVKHLVGLQAQATNPPYIGLWSRVEGFRREDLTRLLYERGVVRSSLLRATQHLVPAADYRWLRALLQPVRERVGRAAFGRLTAGLDLAELAATARELLAGRTLIRPELGRLLAERWPERDVTALTTATQCLLAIVHIPPSGTWNRGGATPFTLAEDWLGDSMDTDPSLEGMSRAAEELVRRYLASFGPATVKDIQAWSGVTRLREVVGRLRPELRVYRDEAGRELYDLPGAPLPDPRTPVPPRFLPEFDNLMVGHADRRRMMTDERRRRVSVGGLVAATLLVDGVVHGMWKIERDGGAAVLSVGLFEPLTGPDRAAVEDEGMGLLAFAAPDAGSHGIRFTPAKIGL